MSDGAASSSPPPRVKAATKPLSTTEIKVKKGHVCPPSNAKHPRDRWETVFVYSFIRRFVASSKGPSQIHGLESPDDLEDALLSPTPHPVLEQILTRFIKNLRPKRGSGPTEAISSAVTIVMAEYMRSSERSVFWDEVLQANVNPLAGDGDGIFAASWDLKLRVLRQLVEWQLAHTALIREKLDNAWGVKHNLHKKHLPVAQAPPPDHPDSKENLQFVPIGQDLKKRRFWIVDDSPRLYVSTNPWKVTSTFECVASTKEEYIQVIEDLRLTSPVAAGSGHNKKLEMAHFTLVDKLESRIEAIDREIQRIKNLRKRQEREQQALQLAELRSTRARRQVRKPEYVYNEVLSDQDEGDEYTFQDEEEEDDEEFEESHSRRSASGSTGGWRRSTRSAVVNANGKRTARDGEMEWRGERRSTRLVALESEKEPPPKREPSPSSSDTPDIELPATGNFPVEVKKHQKIKPTERVLDAMPGKKKSKFWFYAVEAKPKPAPDVSGAQVEERSAETSMDGEATSIAEFPRRRASDEMSGASSPPTSMMDISEDEK